MKTLVYGQQLKSSGFKYQQEITVGTVEGYSNKSKQECLSNKNEHIRNMAKSWDADKMVESLFIGAFVASLCYDGSTRVLICLGCAIAICEILPFALLPVKKEEKKNAS